MLHSGPRVQPDAEWNNAGRIVARFWNVQQLARLQNVLREMCVGLYSSMALAAGGIGFAFGDLPVKISEELLVCKICFGRFHQKKLPKLLACSHTFCEPCVRQYHFINTNGWLEIGAAGEGGAGDGGCSGLQNNFPNFPCPICRKLTRLPDSGVEGLANNFTVLSLMELLDDKQQGHVNEGFCDSDTCSVKSDVIGIVRRNPRRRRRERRGSCCSTFSVPTEVGASMTSLLGIPSIDARCAICERRFPESEFPCGHCVCTKCFGTAQRNNNESDNKDAQVQAEDRVSDSAKCPACAEHTQRADDCLVNAASTVHLNNASPDRGAKDHGCIVSEHQQSSSDSFISANVMADPTHHIYPNLAVETLDSLEYNRTGKSQQTMNCTCKHMPGRNNGRLPMDRPPPYNPDLYFNGNGPVDQQSISVSSSNGNSRNNSPRRALPTHRYFVHDASRSIYFKAKHISKSNTAETSLFAPNHPHNSTF